MDINEISRVRQLLNKNIDDFKYQVLSSMPEPRQKETENLEEWVAREFAPRSRNRVVEPSDDVPGETLEEWVSRQRIKPKATQSRRTFLDIIEQWIINEVKKDLFAGIDVKHTDASKLSSYELRDLGRKLIALADKVEGRSGAILFFSVVLKIKEMR